MNMENRIFTGDRAGVLRRKYAGIEINQEYAEMAEHRLAEIDPLFGETAA